MGTGREMVRDREMGTKRSNDTRRSEEQLEKGAGTETTPKLGQNQGRTEGEGPSQGSRARPGWGRAPGRGHQQAQSKVHPQPGKREGSPQRPGPALGAPCWPLLPPAGASRSAQAGRKVRDTAALGHSSFPPPLPAPLPALPAHRAPPGPVGGAGVLPVTLLAQSSRAV
uniref:Uncharacterized protein n=1 Tax=Monodon monoceros TaxID=40151 RepID=A0A8C6AH06_MONMO